MPLTNPDTRLIELNQWANQQIGSNQTLIPLGGDAGFRRYFRFSPPLGMLAVDAPIATEDTGQFLRVAELLRQHKVALPKIAAADIDKGFLLVEDLGDALVYQQIDSKNADLIYQQAIALLLNMQTVGAKPDWLAEYDQDFLYREMNLCCEWFVTTLLSYSISDEEEQLIADTFVKLAQSANEQPQVFTHRDFHSRNLLITTPNELATIDFQGALWGPITYDLVSLLRDCYLRWPNEKVKFWALSFYQEIQHQPFMNNVSAKEFLKWFDWMGLQRHIKVLGIFARLHIRDNKSHYLQDLPLVIRYILETCNQYTELRAFGEWFYEKLIPILQQQVWYSDHQTAANT